MRYLFILVLVVFKTQFALADERGFEPAKFRDADKIVKKIKFPKVEGDITQIIRCLNFLELTGRIKGLHCDLEGDDELAWLFRKSIYRAIAQGRMDRARVDGRPRAVWVKFMVVFVKKGDEKSIDIYLNHAAEFKRYGMNYIAPQRLIPLEPLERVKGCRRNNNYWVESIVGREGNPYSVELVNSKQIKRCKEINLERYQNRSFIPAYLDGQPVESFYSQRVGWSVQISKWHTIQTG